MFLFFGRVFTPVVRVLITSFLNSYNSLLNGKYTSQFYQLKLILQLDGTKTFHEACGTTVTLF